VADSAALVEALLHDFPEMRFGYHASGSADADLRHLVRHLASITTELVAKEPESQGIAKAFAWAQRLASDNATSALSETFYLHLSPLALTMQPAPQALGLRRRVP
jgi:hypothetical protein